MKRKQDVNLEANQSFTPTGYCRYMGKSKYSSYGNDIPKWEKISPFDAPCIG